MALNTKRGILNLDNVAIFLAELFGTGMLVFFSCSSCIKWDTNSQLDTLQIVLTVGFSVLLAVQTFGCISGGHINPCVTIGAVILNVISFQMGILYVIAQFIGAFMAYGLLTILIPATPLELSNPSFCVTKPAESVTIPQALGIEFIATSTLVWFCCGIWDPRNSRNQDSVAIRLAFAIAGLVSASGSFTGGSMNPARSTGPALWTGDFGTLWIYWVAPISGALISATTYKYVFRREVIETDDYGQHLETLRDEAGKA